MKFTEIVIVYALITVFLMSLFDGLCVCERLSEKSREIQINYETEKFIAESFRATCSGNAFKSLNEWQVSCRAMFNLDYIGWSDAENFMEVDYEKSSKRLYYGKWNGQGCSGEVYCRGLQ